MASGPLRRPRQYAAARRTSVNGIPAPAGRFASLGAGLGLLLLSVGWRLFDLQVRQGGQYAVAAAGQQGVEQRVAPRRGAISLRDSKRGGALTPIAVNQTASKLWLRRRQVADWPKTAAALAPILGITAKELQLQFAASTAGSLLLARALDSTQRTQIAVAQLPGVEVETMDDRYYPDGRLFSHLLGFYGYEGDQRRGRYGLEGYFDQQLEGRSGAIRGDRDALGRLITVGDLRWQAQQDGSDLVLTVDRSIQHAACSSLQRSVAAHQALGGTVIVLDPGSGAVRAMCSLPDFDPNDYRSVPDISLYNNPAIFQDYEPGSVMKAVTMAAALDSGSVRPETTYEDTGQVRVGGYVIRNSDGQAHGRQTMTQVLEQSLNTGAIFAMQRTGGQLYRQYLRAFGFGQPTGIELSGERTGDLRSLDESGDIYLDTASFGQGITVTPLQLAAAYAALVNGGQLWKPYLVEEVRAPNGSVDHHDPQLVRQAIRTDTSAVLSAMLVSVVQRGHSKGARIAGYNIGGKTGTAEIPDRVNGGYLADQTVHTFVGFAPVSQPRFVILTKLDQPAARFAESTAVPLGREIAEFILRYWRVQPDASL